MHSGLFYEIRRRKVQSKSEQERNIYNQILFSRRFGGTAYFISKLQFFKLTLNNILDEDLLHPKKNVNKLINAVPFKKNILLLILDIQNQNIESTNIITEFL